MAVELDLRRQSLQPGQRVRLGIVDLRLHDATVAGQLLTRPGVSPATPPVKLLQQPGRYQAVSHLNSYDFQPVRP